MLYFSISTLKLLKAQWKIIHLTKLAVSHWLFTPEIMGRAEMCRTCFLKKMYLAYQKYSESNFDFNLPFSLLSFVMKLFSFHQRSTICQYRCYQQTSCSCCQGSCFTNNQRSHRCCFRSHCCCYWCRCRCTIWSRVTSNS